MPDATNALDHRDPIELSDAYLRSWPIPLDVDGDKLERGSVLVVGGSVCTPGAVELSGLAALRVGAGRLQLATVESVASALAIAVPEALVEPLPQQTNGTIVPGPAVELLADRVGAADALLFGPGLGDLDSSVELLDGVVDHLADHTVVVLDALGLRCLVELDGRRRRVLTGRLVLTPNRTEARELTTDGSVRAADDSLATDIAVRFGAVAAVHGSIVDQHRDRWIEQHGSVGLGTSGSGDVLAGFVAGVAARSGDAAQAACWGSHVHAVAGARLADRVGRVGYLARELLVEAPRVLATFDE